MPALTDPSVHLTLQLAALACLGLWIATFKLQAGRWRFELFSIDFALGAFLFSLCVALTLGNAGTDLPFTDRMIVSSKTAQVLAFAAGCLFGAGNTLLLGAVSLIGIAAAFGISGGLALALGLSLRYPSTNQLAFLTALVLFLVGSLLAIAASRVSDPAQRSQPVLRGQAPAPIRFRRSTKGILVGVLGSLSMASSFPLALRGAFDDFGLGPYAGLFIFSLGMLLANLVLSLYFFNIALDGGALPMKAYLRDWPGRHIPGIVGGAIWALGGLAILLIRGNPRLDQIPSASSSVPLAAVPLAMVLGILVWREFRLAPRTATLLMLSALVALSIAVVALVFS